jgi:predicted  nucleic acid-binding Zn-ribbon protein
MERQQGSVTDSNELTFMLGELYAMKRRDAQLIDQLTSQRDALEARVTELEAKEAGQQ